VRHLHHNRHSAASLGGRAKSPLPPADTSRIPPSPGRQRPGSRTRALKRPSGRGKAPRAIRSASAPFPS